MLFQLYWQKHGEPDVMVFVAQFEADIEFAWDAAKAILCEHSGGKRLEGFDAVFRKVDPGQCKTLESDDPVLVGRILES